jgi:hypothetical protein
MRNLLEYSDWDATQKKIGQMISLNGDVGQILSYDRDRKLWLVRFEDGVKKITASEMDDIEEGPEGPFGNTTFKQMAAPTLAI